MSHRLKIIYKEICSKFLTGSERSVEVKKNVALTLSLRIFTVFPSILIVPLTINYVNQEQYGIWLTLSSVLALMNLFDFGLSNGFRNRFAEARASNNNYLASQYVSTAYFIISAISLLLLLGFELINFNFDWCKFLNVSYYYQSELRECFAYLILFFCLSLITNILTSLLTADQKPSLASLLQAIGQVLSLVGIYVLRETKVTGNISELAILYSGIPFIVMLLGSIYFFLFTKYRTFRPRFINIKLSLTKSIMSLGLKFFVVTLCSLVIFQLMNIIITRELGAVSVTQYNVAHKYFNILYMPAIIILTPLWSAVTDAYIKRDYGWISNLTKRIEKLWLYCIVVAIIMLLTSSFFYRIWVGDQVNISFLLSANMALYIVVQIIGTAYMYIINGFGKITIQTIVYIVFAIMSYPAFIYAARTIGVEGMLLLPIAFYVIQALLGRVQIHKILNDDCHGLWAR
mgnify:CR=1 FL=1